MSEIVDTEGKVFELGKTHVAEPEQPVNLFDHLSVCIIAHKAEQESLQKLLKTLPKGCEVIVVFNAQGEDSDCKVTSDTSGSDGGRLIVAEFTWSEFSFSVARNHSLGYATREWILWVDTDDILNPSQHDSLVNLRTVPAGVGALMVTVAGMQPALYKGDEPKYYAVPQARLLRNHCGFFFEVPIHEQVLWSVQAKGYTVQQSALIVSHLGYCADLDTMRKKSWRNAAMGMHNIMTNGDTPDLHHTRMLHRDLSNYLDLENHA